MAFSGGLYSRIYNWVSDKNSAIAITASRMDGEFDGMATALSTCLLKDGTQTVTANIPMSAFKITGLGSGTAATDAINVGQVQKSSFNWIASGGTADAITATYSPAITALTDGMLLRFRATGANTVTAPTFAPNGLTAYTITKLGGTALVAGDLSANLSEYQICYNLANTRWELLNPSIPRKLGTPISGVLTNCTGLPILTGISGLSANIDVFLNDPTSAHLKSAMTDEVGTGALVFANTPTLITPVLGTPASGTLTNCTGLPSASVVGLIWAKFTGTTLTAGTAGISIVKNSTGNYTVTIPTQTDINYAPQITCGSSADGRCINLFHTSALVYTAPTTTTFIFSVADTGNTARDFDYCTIMIIR